MEERLKLRKVIVGFNDFRISDYRRDTAYFLLASPGQIQPSLFDKKAKICFINCPFKEAIKIPSYIQKKGKRFVRSIKDEINSLNIAPKKIDVNSHHEQMLIILFNEIKQHDLIFIETTGSDDSSIIRLMNFCLELLKIFLHKMIFIIDISNVSPPFDSNLVIYEFDRQLIDEIENKGSANFTGRKSATDFAVKGTI